MDSSLAVDRRQSIAAPRPRRVTLALAPRIAALEAHAWSGEAAASVRRSPRRERQTIAASQPDRIATPTLRPHLPQSRVEPRCALEEEAAGFT
mmetsp:Transcript_17422/g.37488  ORF Transcript_17422/g.37488 Transcript_17422/m.37488 type:complete len:93 (+) Transcript_17422:106-384(+)|eukprot:6183076-Pleurochrysis_carterae.AAC.2